MHRLRDFLTKIGFQERLSDSSLFIYRNAGVTTYLLVYVDDIVLTSSSKKNIKSLIGRLASEFSIKDLGDLTYFLEINVTRTSQGLFLSQQQYAANLLREENLGNLKPVASPMEHKADFTSVKSEKLDQSDTIKYRGILGGL